MNRMGSNEIRCNARQHIDSAAAFAKQWNRVDSSTHNSFCTDARLCWIACLAFPQRIRGMQVNDPSRSTTRSDIKWAIASEPTGDCA